jgi:hypothetical protein
MAILLEQLVYGSFPFWDRGYDVLARSPGCRAEWVADVLAACRRFGEAPAGVTPAPAIFSLRLPSGPRAIVGIEPQGLDDRGRPGALAFHALLVDPRDDRKAGSSPFAFAGALRRDWSAGTTLAAIPWTVEAPVCPPSPADPRSRRIVEALSKGRRVALESPEPIDRLAREVWPSLPESVRRKGSVATWAFGNANRFDLVALPRLAGIELDRSYLDPASIVAEPGPVPEGVKSRRLLLYYRAAPVVVALVVVAVGLGWWGRQDRPGPTPSPEVASTHPAGNGPALGPEERARVVAGLEALADPLDVGGSNDPGALMATIAARLHYRGATLGPPELARLTAEGDPDRDRALAWHGRITRTFADDRPLPGDFATLPLDRQLDRLAWSFHIPPPPRAEDIPGALLEALSRDGPVRPTPLAARYPPLSDYARFLGKLPRRE